MPLGSQTVSRDSLTCITPRVLKSIRLELTELDFIKDTLVIHQAKDSLLNHKIVELESIQDSSQVIISSLYELHHLKDEEVHTVTNLYKSEVKKNRKHKVIHIASGAAFILLLILIL
jgi:hypothetical protein